MVVGVVRQGGNNEWDEKEEFLKQEDFEYIKSFWSFFCCVLYGAICFLCILKCYKLFSENLPSRMISSATSAPKMRSIASETLKLDLLIRQFASETVLTCQKNDLVRVVSD